MHSLMTPGRPARALLQPKRMVRAADQNCVACVLFKMTAQTKVGIAVHEQFVVDRSMRIVTGRAALTQRLVFKDERTLLGRMTAQAHVVFRKQCRPAAPENRPFVRVMTVGAGHPAFRDGMMNGQLKLRTHVGMTLIAHRFLGTRRRVGKSRPVAAAAPAPRLEAVRRQGVTARIRVDAARPVARFASRVERVIAPGHETGMVGRHKILINIVVTRIALVGPNVGRARIIRQHHGRSIDGAAGNHR